METFGQTACSVGRLPIRFTVGTGGTIRMRVQAARSFFCRAESASVADSAEWVLVRQSGEPGDLRSDRVLGQETGTIGRIIGKHRRQSAWMVAIQGGHMGPPLRL